MGEGGAVPGGPVAPHLVEEYSMGAWLMGVSSCGCQASQPECHSVRREVSPVTLGNRICLFSVYYTFSLCLDKIQLINAHNPLHR